MTTGGWRLEAHQTSPSLEFFNRSSIVVGEIETCLSVELRLFLGIIVAIGAAGGSKHEDDDETALPLAPARLLSASGHEQAQKMKEEEGVTQLEPLSGSSRPFK